LHPITSGKVFFNDEDITRLKSYEIARRGMARTFQVYAASGDLTVEENVMIGCFMRTRSRSQAKERAGEILKELRLKDRGRYLVSELPVASQKKVTMATALASRPKLILLDEVAAGLNTMEIDEIMTTIREIHKGKGITVMLIEHVMELVMKVSDRVIVLDYGEKIAEGVPQDIARQPRVIKAYLGERYVREQGGTEY
jgi:branched-chain amino acid transport system ATP-binding protein